MGKKKHIYCSSCENKSHYGGKHFLFPKRRKTCTDEERERRGFVFLGFKKRAPKTLGHTTLIMGLWGSERGGGGHKNKGVCVQRKGAKGKESKRKTYRHAILLGHRLERKKQGRTAGRKG